MTIRVGMIADDLTGALDAAAPFADRGLRTKVMLSHEPWDPSALTGVEVLCINTASREIAPAEAGQRVSTATARLLTLEPDILFKKVDSRLKGNLVAELGAMLTASGLSSIVLAPAIPDLGRFAVDGKVCGMGVPAPIDMLALCGSLPVTAPDTTDTGKLEAVADAAAKRGKTVLLAGARGLALALARRVPARAPKASICPLPQPTLIAIGSRDTITRAQVDHLTREINPLRLTAPNGLVPVDRPASITLVTTEQGTTIDTGAAVAERFARGLADLVRERCPASMLISGGETAYVLLDRLGVTTLDLGGEALPGVPFFHALIGGKQVVILTKSGGFGSPDTISLLVGVSAELH